MDSRAPGSTQCRARGGITDGLMEHYGPTQWCGLQVRCERSLPEHSRVRTRECQCGLGGGLQVEVHVQAEGQVQAERKDLPPCSERFNDWKSDGARQVRSSPSGCGPSLKERLTLCIGLSLRIGLKPHHGFRACLHHEVTAVPARMTIGVAHALHQLMHQSDTAHHGPTNSE
eukprot:1152816-Pelagomonas_calceolata.AAC.2